MNYRAPWVNFQPKLRKIKMFTPKKFLIFQEMKLSCSKIKTFLIFPEMEFLASYFSYISGLNFPSSKNKKSLSEKTLLYFGKWDFLTPSLKNFLYFRMKEKANKKLAPLKKFLVSYAVFAIFTAVNHGEILC